MSENPIQLDNTVGCKFEVLKVCCGYPCSFSVCGYCTSLPKK